MNDKPLAIGRNVNDLAKSTEYHGKRGGTPDKAKLCRCDRPVKTRDEDGVLHCLTCGRLLPDTDPRDKALALIIRQQARILELLEGRENDYVHVHNGAPLTPRQVEQRTGWRYGTVLDRWQELGGFKSGGRYYVTPERFEAYLAGDVEHVPEPEPVRATARKREKQIPTRKLKP